MSNPTSSAIRPPSIPLKEIELTEEDRIAVGAGKNRMKRNIRGPLPRFYTRLTPPHKKTTACVLSSGYIIQRPLAMDSEIYSSGCIIANG